MTTSDLDPDALACPFCGRGDLLHIEVVKRGFLAVKCWACGAFGPSKLSETGREAIAHWNDRAVTGIVSVREPGVTGKGEGE